MKNVRYGILVQLAHLLAQAFLDWCTDRDVPTEPFSFVVPTACVIGLDAKHTGVLVTITPIEKIDCGPPI
jgi:hypothetical protein